MFSLVYYRTAIALHCVALVSRRVRFLPQGVDEIGSVAKSSKEYDPIRHVPAGALKGTRSVLACLSALTVACRANAAGVR